MRNSVKQKIISGMVFWIFLTLGLYLYIFKNITLSNQKKLESIQGLKKEKMLLEIERDSFLQGKSDLEKVSKEPLKPSNFFSQDITLVNEIRKLESIGRELGIDLSISGVSGTVKSAKKAVTKSDIVQIPVSINVKGSLVSAVTFLEYLENLEFLTTSYSANFNSAEPGLVSMSLTASFYVKR